MPSSRREREKPSAAAGERTATAPCLPAGLPVDHCLAGATSAAGDWLTLWCNDAWRATAAARLSVLIPFRNDDCEPLVAGVIAAAESLAADVEMVVADDGTDDPAMGRRVQTLLAATGVPGALLTAGHNVGRSAIRNRLAERARGRHFLFIDAGMEVPGAGFLDRYLTLAADGKTRLLFGGYAAKAEVLAQADALVASEFQHDQCLPAAVRRQRPWQHVYAGNLLMHREVFAACRFDEGFHGWGWEDVEMGIRAARAFPVEHADNPVLRTTLPIAADLVNRFIESAPNFARLAALHPDEVADLSIFRAARIAARLPLRGHLGRALRRLALANGPLIPVRLRLLALKLYRACAYADCCTPDAARPRPGPAAG